MTRASLPAARPPKPRPVRGLERATIWITAAGILVVAIGLPPLALARAGVTRTLLAHVHSRPLSGQSRDGAVARELARGELARLTIDPFAGRRLASTAADRLRIQGFTESEISHLADVRGAFGLALWFVGAGLGASAGALAAALGVRLKVLSAAATRAAALGTASVLVLAVAGAVAFESLFAAFHGLFFAPGTWVFPAGSLLIGTFPGRFWTIAAVAWGFGTIAILLGVWLVSGVVFRYHASQHRVLPA